MQWHELKLNSSHQAKKPKRVGRGGKRGTTSGRGQKGQASRAGHRIRPALRDLMIRIPKRRGFKNKSLVPKPYVISLGALTKLSSGEVTLKTLQEAGVIRKAEKNVKILGEGEVKKAFTVSGIKVSASAKEKIEKAGGKVV